MQLFDKEKLKLKGQKLGLEIEEAEIRAEKAAKKMPAWALWSIIAGIAFLLPAYLISKFVSFKIWEAKYRPLALSAHQSFTEVKPLQTGEINIFPTGDGSFGAVTSIINENLDLSLDKTTYRLRFFNSKDEEVYISVGTFTLLPNQTKYLVVPRINSSERPSEAKLELPEKLAWQRRYSLPSISLIVSSPDLYLQSNPEALVVEGYYQNQSPYQLGKVTLTFLIYDGRGRIIAASTRDDFTVQPYERRSYKQLWPNFSPGTTAKVKVFAETDLLDYTNFGTPALDTGPASDLSRPKQENQNF